MEKSAYERKSVFTEILGLDQYEVMESYVKDLKKELNSTIKFNQEKLSKLENIISNKDSFESELNNITFELPDIEKEISKYEKMLEKELSELKSQMLTLTMNICLDLTCKRRIVETAKSNNKELSKQKEQK